MATTRYRTFVDMRQRRLLTLELLEDRRVLSASPMGISDDLVQASSATGLLDYLDYFDQGGEAPDNNARGGATTFNTRSWVSVGPASARDGQVENIIPNDRVTGAIHAVLTHPADPDTIYVGTINGGVWKTTNATDTDPVWTALTDFQDSLSISALAFDSADTTYNTVVAATGNYSSYGSQGGPRVGIFRSIDGGATWDNPGSQGLVGENISGIAVRGETIVATSSLANGGVFRSTDAGTTFAAITGPDFVPGNDFFDLAVDASDALGQRLYAAAEDRGIYRSDDFGQTWTKITGPGINADMDSLITDSSNNNTEMAVHPATGRLYVAILQSGQPRGVFYSDTASTSSPTWTRMDVPVLPQGEATPVVGASNASPIVITSPDHQLFSQAFVVVSGVTGNTAANGWYSVTVIDQDRFALDGTSGNGVYLEGGNWTRVTGPNPRPKETDEPGSQGRIHFSIAVDPSDHEIIYMGGDRQDFPNVLEALDYSGALFRGDASIAPDPTVIPSPQWDHLTHGPVDFDPSGGTANASSPHADSRDMAFDMLGNLIEVDDGGIFKRTSPRDNTGDWYSLAGNLQVTEFHDIAYDTTSNVIIAGTQDNGTQFQPAEGQQMWELLHGGDGGDVAVDTVSLAAVDQSIRYTSFQFLGGFRKTTWDAAGNLLTTDFPSLSVIEGGEPFSGQFSTPIALNNVDPMRLLFGGFNSLYETHDQGETIVEAAPGLRATGSVSGNAIDYGGRSGGSMNPDVAYVGDTSGMVHIRTSADGPFVSTDPSPPAFSPIRDVVMNPHDWTNAFVVDNDNVFATANGGTSWSTITGNLSGMGISSLRSMAFVTGFSDALVVGTNKGVFASSLASLGTWLPVGAGLPNAPVWDMAYDPTDDVLVAGTLGRGAWSLYDASFEIGGGVLGDFNQDGVLDCPDIDTLVTEITSGLASPRFDLNADLRVDNADLTTWLALAGAVNLPSGNAYLQGDANLDGVVDGQDFIVWNNHKFSNANAWCMADFDADGSVGQLDFDIWNANRFQSALGAPPSFVSVPGIATNPFDVGDANYDGHISPLDALLLINELDRREFTDSSSGRVLFLPEEARFADATGDGAVTPLDALMVINELDASPLPEMHPVHFNEGSLTIQQSDTDDDETEDAPVDLVFAVY